MAFSTNCNIFSWDVQLYVEFNDGCKQIQCLNIFHKNLESGLAFDIINRQAIVIPSNLAALASKVTVLVHRIMISHIDGDDLVVVD